MDRQLKRWLLLNVVRPPLELLRLLFSPIGLLLGCLDRFLARRYEKRLGADVVEAMPFLFTTYRGRIVPNEEVPFPPGFDYAFVTVEVETMLIRFCRGRGELDVQVGSKQHPRDLHELGLVLGLLDENGEYKRSGISSLYQAGQTLGSNMHVLKRALTENMDEELVRRLREVAANDRIAIQEAEWEINKHLR